MSPPTAVITSLLLILPLTVEGVVTPSRPIGFKYGQSINDVRVQIEFYIDLVCPDSKEAWPHMLEVADVFRAQGVELTVHLFPLPYHQNSFYASRAAYVIHYLSEGQKTFEWIDRILVHEIPNIKDSTFHNDSDADLLEHFKTIAADISVDVANFTSLTDRRHSNRFETATRYAWKHAAAKGVFATPTWYVNDMYQPQIQQSWARTEWTTFLQPLLEPDIFDGISASLAGYGDATVDTKANECNSGSREINKLQSAFLLIASLLAFWMVWSRNKS